MRKNVNIRGGKRIDIEKISQSLFGWPVELQWTP